MNSPYEEGIFVLTENPDGNGNIAFMRKLTEAEKTEGKREAFENNCFTTNNPGLTLGKGISDVVKRVDQLFIASTEGGKISLINTKTFELESEITAPDIPNFRPYRLNIPDDLSTSSMVLSENGKVYKLATLEHLIMSVSGLPTDLNFAMRSQFVAGMNFTSNYFWDKKNSQFWNLWYINTNSKNTLSNQELICFFATASASYTLTYSKRDETRLTRTKFGPYIQEYMKDPVEILEQEEFYNTASTIKPTSVTVLNDKLNKLIYANDNKVYQWYYSGTNIPSSPYIEIDNNNKILSMNVSPDGKELYIATHNNNLSGLKGCMYIYNADNGTLLSKHEGVFDKPVKVFYKNKK